MVAKQTVLTQQLLFLNGFCITLRAFQKSQNQKHEVWKNWCFTGFRFQRLISKTCRGMTCKRKTHNNCNLQRLTKELRQKRTGHRHGKQKKNSSKPSRWDNRSTQGPHPPIRNKRTVRSDNCRKVQSPSVGANWIPGGHLRFQRLSNSKP